MRGASIIKKNTTRRRNIIVLICCLFISICLSFCSCKIESPTGDWSYDLPNEYSIQRLNPRQIVLVSSRGIRIDGQNAVTHNRIESYITSFCTDGKYVAVRHVNPSEVDFENYSGNTFDKAAYFLVDTSNDELYGPFDTLDDFNNCCELIGVGQLSQWIDTYPMPNGAY